MSTLDALGFCPELCRALEARTATGRSGKVFDGLTALSSVNNLVVLRKLFLELKPRRTMEIGLCFGGSCLVFTAGHRELGRAPEQQHIALDPFQSEAWDDCGLLAVERAGLAGYLDFRPRFSHSELPRLLDQKASFDLVYVDGSHLFEDVFIDLFYVSRLLAPDGVMVFDDSPDPHVQKVLRFLRANLGASFQELDLGRFRTDGGRSVKYRVAKRLRRNQMTAFQRVGPAVREWNAAFRNF